MADLGAEADDCELSIVIGSSQPWPEMRLPLESLRQQLGDLRAEVLVGLAHPDGMDRDYAEAYPVPLRIFCHDGASVFWLRTRGISLARGEVIAVTEDHCRVHADWCGQILRAHRDHPETSMIGGPVDNGADRALIDWANYFVSNIRFMPPVAAGFSDSISTQANLSLKQRAKPKEESELGNMEMLLVAELAKAGERFYIDPSIGVDHVQAHGFWNTFAVHFHNGRSIAGFRRERCSMIERLLRLASTPILAVWLVVRPWLFLLKKRRRWGWALLSTPLMFALGCCHAVGEAVGYLLGPGQSPAKMK